MEKMFPIKYTMTQVISTKPIKINLYQIFLVFLFTLTILGKGMVLEPRKSIELELYIKRSLSSY